MNKMLLITDIKSVWVPSDRYVINTIPRYEYHNLVAKLNAPDYSQVENVTTEMVEGVRFARPLPNGGRYEICLGISSDASKALGMPFECLDNVESQLTELRTELSKITSNNSKLRESVAVARGLVDSIFELVANNFVKF